MTNNPKTGINGGYKAILNPTDLDSEIDQILGLDVTTLGVNAYKFVDVNKAKAQLQAIIARQLLAELEPLQKEAQYESDRAERKDLHSNVDGVLDMLNERIDQLKAEAAQKGEDRE